MKAFYLKDHKQFMNQLLKSELFDHFLLAEATIQGAVSYHIDGKINHDFFANDEFSADDSAYLPFSQLRPICYELIRGKHTPLYFKFVFLLSASNMKKTIAASGTDCAPEEISGMFFNLIFRDGKMTLTTGVSYRSFTLDHSLDAAWDTFAARFLSNHCLDFDVC